MSMRFPWLIALFLNLSLIQTSQAADPSPISEIKLDNGLRVIVKEDHRAPVVVSQVWYKVGSSYEHDGITGIFTCSNT